MASTDPAPDSEGQSPDTDSPPRVSFQNEATVIEENSGVNNEAGESSSTPIPLHRSSRLKGYITLLTSAIYNFMAASKKNKGGGGSASFDNLCVYYDDLGNLVDIPLGNHHRVRFAMACSMITIIVTGAIILCHFDFCTPLRKTVWPKWFGPQSKVELCILLFLIMFWFIATWLNTSIRGPAGEGQDAFNLYFSSWICCWATFWTLERWCTASGIASFERFVRSWPNRCPLWIVSLILSLADFLFALDVSRHWEEGTKYSPYVAKLYSEVSDAEWTLILFVTCLTFIVSLAWVLAEIFRESRTNKVNAKSDVEVYAEGLTVQIITIIWIVTVCIATMPGGAASLLGNLYFTTWSTLFAVIGTLIWWVRDWRQGILDVIEEQQEEYEKAKRTIRKREEKRLARLAGKETEKNGDDTSEVKSTDESKADEDDDAVLCEDDPAADDDITFTSHRSRLGSSITSSPERPTDPASSDASQDDSGILSVSRSLFQSAVSYLYPDADADEPQTETA